MEMEIVVPAGKNDEFDSARPTPSPQITANIHTRPSNMILRTTEREGAVRIPYCVKRPLFASIILRWGGLRATVARSGQRKEVCFACPRDQRPVRRDI